jgi:hypothetical protein
VITADSLKKRRAILAAICSTNDARAHSDLLLKTFAQPFLRFAGNMTANRDPLDGLTPGKKRCL